MRPSRTAAVPWSSCSTRYGSPARPRLLRREDQVDARGAGLRAKWGDSPLDGRRALRRNQPIRTPSFGRGSGPLKPRCITRGHTPERVRGPPFDKTISIRYVLIRDTDRYIG
jgi:hypothetical protein